MNCGMAKKLDKYINILNIYEYFVCALEENYDQPPVKAGYEKLAIRCSFGITNAGRNPA